MHYTGSLLSLNAFILRRLLIFQTARYHIEFDGLIHSLEIKKTRNYDTGEVRAVAKNSYGEAACSANLTITPANDLRAHLKHAPKCEQLLKN